MIKTILQTILNLVVFVLWKPLDIVLLPVALISIIVKVIIRRFRDIEGDLRTMLPNTRHKLKLWDKKRKKR